MLVAGAMFNRFAVFAINGQITSIQSNAVLQSRSLRPCQYIKCHQEAVLPKLLIILRLFETCEIWPAAARGPITAFNVNGRK